MTEKNVVISDCRFFNELNVIKRLGGTTAVVWRDSEPEWWGSACKANIEHAATYNGNTIPKRSSK